MPDLEQIRSTLARIDDPVVLLESLFAYAPVGFQIYDASGRSILVNQAFIDLFGSEPPPGLQRAAGRDRAAARIKSSAERMARMISEVLDFTQARLGGRIPLHRRPTDLGEIDRAVTGEVLAVNPAQRAVDNAGPPIPEGARGPLRPLPPRHHLRRVQGAGARALHRPEIARAHGGDVTLQAADGRTTFRATLQR